MSCVSEGPSLALRLALVGLSFPFNLQKMPRHHSKLGGKKLTKSFYYLTQNLLVYKL